MAAKRLAPDPASRYTVIDVKRGGFSRGYTLLDPDGREWNAKLPAEATTEVAASRILWGVGYHQPPIYYLAEWDAEKAPSPNPQLPARFREKKPDLYGLDAGRRPSRMTFGNTAIPREVARGFAPQELVDAEIIGDVLRLLVGTEMPPLSAMFFQRADSFLNRLFDVAPPLLPLG